MSRNAPRRWSWRWAFGAEWRKKNEAAGNEPNEAIPKTDG